MRREKIIWLMIRPKAESKGGYEKIAFLHKSASQRSELTIDKEIRIGNPKPHPRLAAIVCLSSILSRRIIHPQQHPAAAANINIAALGFQSNFA